MFDLVNFMVTWPELIIVNDLIIDQSNVRRYQRPRNGQCAVELALVITLVCYPDVTHISLT